MTKLLIVDDSRFDREKFIRALNADESCIFEFQELDTGENLDSVTSEWNPDLVVLDYSLPAFDGIELMKRLVQK